MIIPTMAIGALRWLNENLDPKHTLFEWGTGDSTFWYAERVRKLYSVTDCRATASWVRDEIFVRQFQNTEIILAAKDVADQEGYIVEPGTSVKRYCHSIEQFPTRSFDCIVIDGYKREKCLPLAMQSIKHAGIIVMTETSIPEHLDSMNQMLTRAIEFHHIKGVSTTQDKMTQTTIMRVI